MQRHTHRRLLASGLLMAATLAACSDHTVMGPTAPSQMAAPSSMSFDRLTSSSVIPTPAQVVVTGPDAGMFQPFLANNSGRATTEFWDNLSADNNGPANQQCNVGFYASGTLSPNCRFEIAGSTANQGGYAGGTYLASGGNKPASFMFNGAYSYTVKALGSYTLYSSEIGWFTKVGTVYTFHPLNLPINGTVTINTGGQNFGFYISNNFNPAPGGCNVSPKTNCSDAIGGYATVPYQQFVLFANASGTSYLVGAENNKLETMDTGNGYDSDYNDFMMSVVPAAISQCKDDDADKSKMSSSTKKSDDDCDKTKKCDADKTKKDPKSHDENHDCRSESGEQNDKKWH
jgi:hypothetical protein